MIRSKTLRNPGVNARFIVLAGILLGTAAALFAAERVGGSAFSANGQLARDCSNTPRFRNFRGWRQLNIEAPNKVTNRISFTLHCQ